MDGVLLVNKEKEWTSFDVVAVCRKSLRERSVGHTGTLDPNATGVLVVLFGKACKCLPFLSNETKEYVATLKLGQKTDTGDIWGNVIEQKDVPELSMEILESVLEQFRGKITQIPPMVSAIKVNGKKLYEYAREGKEVERKERNIEIFELECLQLADEIKIRCLCSSGTYIRTLCEDIAEKLGTVGTMTSLVRTKVGKWSLDDCVSIDAVRSGNVELKNVSDLLISAYPTVEFKNIDVIKNGKRIHLDCEDELICVTNQNVAIAMYEKQEDGWYKSKRGLW